MVDVLSHFLIRRSATLPAHPNEQVVVDIFKSRLKDEFISLDSLAAYFVIEVEMIRSYIEVRNQHLFSTLFEGEFEHVGNITGDTIFIQATGLQDLNTKFNEYEVNILTRLVFSPYGYTSDASKSSYSQIYQSLKYLNELIAQAFVPTTSSKHFQLKDMLKCWGDLIRQGEKEAWLGEFLHDITLLPLERVYSIVPKYIQHLFNHQLRFQDIMHIIICIFGNISVDHDKLKRLYMDNAMTIHSFKPPTNQPLHALAKSQISRSNKTQKYISQDGAVPIAERDAILRRILAQKKNSTASKNFSYLDIVDYKEFVKLPHPDSLRYGNISKRGTMAMNSLQSFSLLFMELANREIFSKNNHVAEIRHTEAKQPFNTQSGRLK